MRLLHTFSCPYCICSCPLPRLIKPNPTPRSHLPCVVLSLYLLILCQVGPCLCPFVYTPASASSLPARLPSCLFTLASLCPLLQEVKRHSLLLAERNAYDMAVAERNRFVREVGSHHPYLWLPCDFKSMHMGLTWPWQRG